VVGADPGHNTQANSRPGRGSGACVRGISDNTNGHKHCRTGRYPRHTGLCRYDTSGRKY